MCRIKNNSSTGESFGETSSPYSCQTCSTSMIGRPLEKKICYRNILKGLFDQFKFISNI